MAIDGLSKLSNDQLLAMNMVGNGQITNDSESSNTGNETNYAFQLMMKNLQDSTKKSQIKPPTVSYDNDKVDNKDKADSKSDNNEEKGDKSSVAVSKEVPAAKVGQTYATGQKLEEIPMTLTNNYVNFSRRSNSILSNRSDADMKKIYSAVDSASKKYGVDSSLIFAIIKQESDFNPNDKSGAGAAGLMQIMPENFASLGITDQYDVNQNVDGGTKLFKEYLDQYNGSIEMALMAYNGGPGTMQRRGVNSAADLYKMPEETQNYVPKVMGYYRNGV